MSGLTTFLREERMKGRELMKKPGNHNFGEKGNTGIKWMDKRYNDNMAKWQAEEDARNAPPTPASGNGRWVQGEEGPIWLPGQTGVPPDPYGPLYAGGNPNFDEFADPRLSTTGVFRDQNQDGIEDSVQQLQQGPDGNWSWNMIGVPGMAPPNFQYPQQGLPPYLQQYLMMQQQMSQGGYPGAY